jgi:L-cysteate sulfo-lyase
VPPSDALSNALAAFPEAGLLPNPSPIHRLSRLSTQLGREIYILRDDLTGFALGGNKTRKLDFLMGDALAKAADTLVTSKATSFSRNAAAAGKVFGMEVHVLIDGEAAAQNPASQAFFEQYDTRLHYVPHTDPAALLDAQAQLVETLKAQGKSVCELHPGGSDAIGALGYVRAFQQIIEFARTRGIAFSKILFPTSSCGTQAGLVMGQCLSGYSVRIIGMAVSVPAERQRSRVLELVSATAAKLGYAFDPEAVLVDDRFIGTGYAIPSPEGQAAVKLFAGLEGILMDQVYTGKAAAGLLHLASNGEIAPGETVLFIHTGGNGGLFY